MKRLLLLGVLVLAIVSGTSVADASTLSLEELASYTGSCPIAMGQRVVTAVVWWEHRGHPDPWAIGVNVDARRHYSYSFGSMDEAVSAAEGLEQRGYTNLDLGLAQLNTSNLAAQRLTIETAFEPCANLRAGSNVLAGFYRRAAAKYGAGSYAMDLALRGYNTGSYDRGQGYASSVWSIAAALPSWIGQRASAGGIR